PTSTGVCRCSVGNTGATASCSPPDSYNYGFTFHVVCGVSFPAQQLLEFYVSGPNRPWTLYDRVWSTAFLGPGENGISGALHEPDIPTLYTDFRIDIGLTWGGCSNHTSASGPPTQICGSQVELTP